MVGSNQSIKDRILQEALPDIPFDGWADRVLDQAAIRAGYGKDMARAVFPLGRRDAVAYFSRWLDDRMLEGLSGVNPRDLRVRDRISAAVRARLAAMEPYKEAERLAIAYWMRPVRKWEGAGLVWKTADTIWGWAGDDSQDYNRYTKRGLLSGVLASTTLFWLSDSSDGHHETVGFLHRRLENILGIGKIVAKLKTS